MALTHITGVSLTVPDIEAAESFYVDALGFIADEDPRAGAPSYAAALGVGQAKLEGRRLRLGLQEIELLAFDPPGRPYPADSTASDLWFQHCAIVVRDMAEAYDHISRFAPQPITQGGPQQLPPNTGAVTAWKFRDPFGHPLELLHFPVGVGHPDWHRSEPPLFMGIDHTALAVSDVEAATAFYAKRFGFKVASRSHNRGPEQSRLDDIPDAEVEVVALTASPAPPHLELLGYRTGERRRRPAHWTSVDVAVSRTLIAIEQDPDRGGDQRLTLSLEADPDGHLIVVRQAGLLPSA